MLVSRVIQSLLLLFPFFLNGQSYYFANYGVKDGLAQSNVSGIIQDSSGFYWIATDGGVTRFDGRNYINYTTDDGLSDNNVSAIFQDKNSHIWMGHENGGLTVYDGKSFTQIKSRLLPKDKKIYGFFQDKSGSLWISTATAGVIKIIDPKRDVKDKFHIKVYSSREGLSQYVVSTLEENNGNTWFLTDVGIKIYDKAARRFEFFRPEGMPMGQITSLAQDKNGKFLIGTSNGLVSRYDPQKKSFEALISAQDIVSILPASIQNIIFSIYEDSKQNIWASVSNSGVIRYSKADGAITLFQTANGLSVNKIKCITEDREGNILLGTLGEGIDVFSGEKFVSYSKENGLADNQVWAICKDKKGNFWFGTNEGLSLFNPKEKPDRAYKNITTKNGLPTNNVRAIAGDKNGDLWIGTWGGKIVRFDNKSGVIKYEAALNELVNRFVSCLMIDSKNRLWAGTYEGIVNYDLESKSIKTYRTIDGLSDNDITALFEDSFGNIWIGTKQKGVSVFDGKTFKNYTRDQGLGHNNISSIAEDAKHQIWIGTEGGGVFVFDGKNFINYKVKNGLLSDFVTLITVDNKTNVWLGTNKGLNKFVPSKTQFLQYVKNDGFTGVETKPRAVFNDEDGSIWFGTVNGAFKYNPLEDAEVIIEPISKILQFRVNLKEQPLLKHNELSYKENSLIFDFVGISLSNPEAVSYRIKLEGYDENWKTVTHNSEIYSNLSHGKYVFNLISCNRSGGCSSPAVVTIKITPPYWKTWWFYLLVITITASALFMYIKLRERKLLQEKSILEDKVSERTAEVLEKNKELDEKNKDITASIRYAKRIQDAILPPDDFVKTCLPNTFVLFKPKDIVSGDFYWMEQKNNSVIFAAVDCTGHGVPGAFMSIVGHNLLDRVVSEQNITKPAQILDELNKSLSDTLRQTNLEDNTVRDGMDISICTFHKEAAKLEFAGAYNPLWLIRNNELIEIKADKFPIGNSRAGDHNNFSNHEVQLQKGDTVYIFSDGYSDQFGGPKGKKFKTNAFKQLLINSQHLPMEEQGRLLDETIENWRGHHEQVDDILVIGTRY
jgi:ligand-binding sensor domain-containing protein/serine phosphatase RsbU (regulator of sigma subunit)